MSEPSSIKTGRPGSHSPSDPMLQILNKIIGIIKIFFNSSYLYNAVSKA